MNINTDSLATFVLLWGIPLFLMTRAYLKMDAADQKSAMDDFKSRRFIFTLGFVGFGFFLIHLGSLLSFSFLKTIGISLLAVGGVFSIIDTWKISKRRSMMISGLICLMIYMNIR